MDNIQKPLLRGIVVAIVSILAAIALMPAVAHAEGESQKVKSSWTEIVNIYEDYSYHWCIRMTLTIADGIVTGAECDGMAVGGGDIPPMEKPYYAPCHIIMEASIEDAGLHADNPDAVDTIDVVSGATHTSTAIKKATKEALVTWNERVQAAQRVVEAINAIASSTDLETAVKEARAAYDALPADYKTLVSNAEYAILTDAEASVELAKKAAEEAAAEMDIANGTVEPAAASYPFANKPIEPTVTVKTKNGIILTQGIHYTVSYENNVNVGMATIIVTAKAPYKGTKPATFAITKAKQTITPAKATYKVKFAQVKKKAVTVAVAFNASGGGKVTYAAAKSGKVSIAKNGKVTVKKGAKKGTYTLSVKATAADSGNYAQTTQTVKLTVKVA